MFSRSTIRRLRWCIAPAILIALWLPGMNQGGFRVDTGLYAAVSLHAFRDGSLFPLMAGELPYFNKPPLAFWIHGFFLNIFGPELWAARLPSLLAAIAGTVLITIIGGRLASPRIGLLAGVILALTLEWFRYTRAISLDLWVTVFLLGAVLCAANLVASLQHSRPGSMRRDLIHAAGAGVCMGLALMTKPLTGLLAAPLLAVWMAWVGVPMRRALAFAAISLLAALAVAAPWHIAMHLRFPSTFLAHYLGKQSLDRAAGEGFDAKPAWYYAELIGQTYWPWLLTMLAAALAMIRRRTIDKSPRRAATRLCIVWSIAWLLALSLFAAKMGRYAVVLYPVLALLSALWLMHAAPRPVALARRAIVRHAAPILLVVCAGMALFGVRIHAPMSRHWDELNTFLSEHDPEHTRLWTNTDMLWTAANVYLARGAWPRFISPSSPAPVGSLILYSDPSTVDAASSAPTPTETEIWRSSRLFITEQR